MKRLIINADDFGLTLGVSEGIAQAMRQGVVTSTTIMGNMPDLPQQLPLLKGLPQIGCGIHLTLSAGKPLLPMDRVGSLVDDKGDFRRNFRLAVQLADVREVEDEWRAQIERVLGLGVIPTHLDSHHHVHLSPKLTPLAIKLAQDYSVPAIRRLTARDVINEDNLLRNIFALPLVVKSARLILQSGLHYPEGVMSLSQKHMVTLKDLPTGTYEMFCHPGFVDDALRAKSSLLEVREEEVRFLTDPKLREFLKRIDVELVSYNSLIN